MIHKAYFGGGCFWGMQDLFRKIEGVVKTTTGYSGGEVENPTYESHKGHAEVLEVEYNSEKINYIQLLDFFFRVHNPTTLNQQGNDTGTSYRSVILYSNEQEKKEAQEFIERVNASHRWDSPVVTSLESFVKFTPAEEYHQDYLIKNPGGYTCHFIRFGTYL